MERCPNFAGANHYTCGMQSPGLAGQCHNCDACVFARVLRNAAGVGLVSPDATLLHSAYS